MRYICIIILLLFYRSIYATDYYVSYSTGNDLNNGLTQEMAWKTTNKVKTTTTFKSIDRILFKSGDIWQSEIDCESYCFYIGNQQNKQYASLFSSYGSGNQPILPRIGFYGNQLGYKFNNLKFVYYGTNPANHACFINQNKNIEFRNAVFENDNFGDTVLIYKSVNIKFINCVVSGGNEAGITLNQSDNCLIQNCNISGFVNAILCYQQSDNNIIRLNICYSLDSDSGAPIELGWGNPSFNKVYSNTIYSNNYGLFVSGTNNLVYNNLILNSKSFSLVLSANTNNNTPKCSYNRIYNNTFYNGKRIYIGHWVNPDNDSINNQIINNIFYLGDDLATIQFTDDSLGDSVLISNNCFYSSIYGNFKMFIDGSIINDITEANIYNWFYNNISLNIYISIYTYISNDNKNIGFLGKYER